MTLSLSPFTRILLAAIVLPGVICFAPWWVSIVIWFGTGVLAYGRSLAYWQREPGLGKRDRMADVRFSACLIPFGPITFATISDLWRSEHGYMWWPPKA